jgi:hypothetical protein
MTGKQRRIVGDVVCVPLRTGRYGFGHVLKEPLIAFFNYEVADPSPNVLAQLAEQPPAFKVWVMNHAVKSGRWKVIGKLPLTQSDQVMPKFFKQDSITGQLSVTTDGGVRSGARRRCTLGRIV